MYLFLVRHGETYLNKYGKMQGWADSPLTESGRNIAKKCGQVLKGVRFSKVFTSDMGRTVETAEIIQEILHPSETVPITQLKAFRETFFGSFEGSNGKRTWKTVAERAGYQETSHFFKELPIDQIMDCFSSADPAGDAENYQEFWSRIAKGLTFLENRSEKNENVLLVTHGNTIRNIAFHYDPTIDCSDEVINSGITIIKIASGKGQIIQYNKNVIESEMLL